MRRQDYSMIMDSGKIVEAYKRQEKLVQESHEQAIKQSLEQIQFDCENAASKGKNEVDISGIIVKLRNETAHEVVKALRDNGFIIDTSYRNFSGICCITFESKPTNTWIVNLKAMAEKGN